MTSYITKYNLNKVYAMNYQTITVKTGRLQIMQYKRLSKTKGGRTTNIITKSESMGINMPRTTLSMQKHIIITNMQV